MLRTASSSDALAIRDLTRLAYGKWIDRIGRSRLLKLAEDLAAAEGLDGVRLFTHQRFEENLRFYRARGYGVDREEPISGGAVVHLSKAMAR